MRGRRPERITRQETSRGRPGFNARVRCLEAGPRASSPQAGAASSACITRMRGTCARRAGTRVGSTCHGRVSSQGGASAGVERAIDSERTGIVGTRADRLVLRGASSGGGVHPVVAASRHAIGSARDRPHDSRVCCERRRRAVARGRELTLERGFVWRRLSAEGSPRSAAHVFERCVRRRSGMGFHR